MKKITFLICGLLITFGGFAQIDVVYEPGPGTADPVKISFSFVEAVDDGSPIINPGDDGNAAFGYSADFTQTYSGTDVTIIPNTEIWTSNNGSDVNFNTFWFSAQGVPRKTLDVLTFNELQWDGNGDAPEILNQEITFSVDLTDYTLDPAYTLSIIVTVFEAGFTNFRRESVEIPSDGSGTYSVTFSNVSANDRIWQWGFFLNGPMADPADNTLGDAEFAQTVLSIDGLELNDFSVSPNPTENLWKINGNTVINEVQVFDILGKNVLTVQPNEMDAEIDATGLKSGLYLARISSSNGTKTMKLIKN